MSEVLRDLKDPENGKSLLENTRTRRNRGGTASPDAEPPGFHLGALGAGSDYVAFIDHLGVASLSLGFGAPNLEGVYHSIYDNPAWFEKFADPGLVYGAALSNVTATTLLRLANAPVLPFEFGEFAATVHRYVDQIKKQSETKVDFQSVLAELAKTESDAKAYEAALANAASLADNSRLAGANQALYESERALTLPQGLPGRDWYRHQIYAPGLYTGYGVKTLPGIREAVEASRWDEANREAQNVVLVLQHMNQRIEEATKLLAN